MNLKGATRYEFTKVKVLKKESGDKVIEIKGKYNTAKVFTDNVEETAVSQIIELCNQEFSKDSMIRIMPDTHAGAGCVIGTTMTIQDKIVPNLVGVDIGCGMEVVEISSSHIDLPKLDKVIHQLIPSGFDIRKREHDYADEIDFDSLKCRKQVNINRAKLSIGTLGGGNHFIEVNQDDSGRTYIVIHSGSRHLGKQVAEYYQGLGYKELVAQQVDVQELIVKLKREGKEKRIEAELKKIKQPHINRQLAYIEKESFQNYLHDMDIVQKFAMLNRKAMMDEIVRQMKLKVVDQFTTIHNYIDMETMILRKGSVSAREGEILIIPINMRDGSLICSGKGNPDWNSSAPHGAGRIMSRSKAKENVSMQEFKKSMEGIFTTSVNRSTVDEAPMAYKSMQEIIDNIQDTVSILKVIKPIYNFKAAGD